MKKQLLKKAKMTYPNLTANIIYKQKFTKAVEEDKEW